MREYYITDDFEAHVNEEGEHVFLHLVVHNWNKKTLKELRMAHDLVRVEYKHKGHVAIFATTDDKKVVKFWNTVVPCDFVNRFGPKDEYYIGAWVTEEEEDGN